MRMLPRIKLWEKHIVYNVIQAGMALKAIRPSVKGSSQTYTHTHTHTHIYIYITTIKRPW